MFYFLNIMEHCPLLISTPSYCLIPLGSIFSQEPEAFIFSHKLCHCHSSTHNFQWLPIFLSIKVKPLVSEILYDLALYYFSFHTFFLTHFSSDTPVTLLLTEHSRHTPSSGTLHRLFCLKLSPQIVTELLSHLLPVASMLTIWCKA